MFIRQLALSLLIACPMLASGDHENSARIEQLSWMSGCWASDGAEVGSGEQWMRPAGGAMLGMSRFVRSGKTVAYEFTRIFENENGSLSFFAAPSGQASHTFELASISANEVVFEDPQHDFPQRILYRLVAPDRMHGRIEGVSEGKSQAIDFPLTRLACDD